MAARALEKLDCVVIGAGVVGLGIARALALAGREVTVLESANRIGSETSARSSEVIHAGIYYAKDTVRAKMCVQGQRHLYRYLKEKNVPHKQCGKMIVATSEAEVPVLEKIRQIAIGNGINSLYFQSKNEIHEMEPEVSCTASLFSPETGIIDSHGLMMAYQTELEDKGGMVILNTPVVGGEIRSDDIVLHTGGADAFSFSCRNVINSAGLHAWDVAKSLQGMPKEHIPARYLAKGNYFTITPRPFKRLVYPVPDKYCVGVHVTVNMDGAVRFGPDVEWVDKIDYRVDPRRADVFYHEIRKFYPALPDDCLVPDYSGIRPKVQGPGDASEDFHVQTAQEHGIPHLVNMFGIESPGLTSSIALGEFVASQVMGKDLMTKV